MRFETIKTSLSCLNISLLFGVFSLERDMLRVKEKIVMYIHSHIYAFVSSYYLFPLKRLNAGMSSIQQWMGNLLKSSTSEMLILLMA